MLSYFLLLKIEEPVFGGHQKYIKIAPEAQSASGHLSYSLLPYRWAPKIQFGYFKGGSQRMGYVKLGLSGANGKSSSNDRGMNQ